MTATDIDPRSHLADLEARVLDGDDTVTAAALQKARAAVDLADLQNVSAQRRAAAEETARREAEADAFRAEIDAAASQLGPLQTAYSDLVAALRTFTARIDEHAAQRRTLIARGKALGLADEADTLLPDLGRRDWIVAATDDAAGRIDRSGREYTTDGVLRRAPTFHALHGPKLRRQIEDAAVERDAASAQRLRERNAEAEQERASTEALQRSLDETAATRAAERLERSKVKPIQSVNR